MVNASLQSTFSLLIALGFLSVSPALSDSMDVSGVSVEGSASGTGSLLVESCFPAPSPCSSPTLNFGAPNAALGAFSTSGSLSFMSDSLTMQAQQMITASADSIDMSFTDTTSATAGLAMALIKDIENSTALTFNLASESVVNVMGGEDAPEPFTSVLVDSNGNTLFTFPNTSSFDSQLTLDAGTYSLLETTNVVGTGFTVGEPGTFSLSQNFFLDADFTPIPEARWTCLGLILPLALCGLVFRRTHRRTSTDRPSL